MSEVAAEYFPNPLAILSGPTFAIEVAKGLPASVTLACGDAALGQKLARLVTHPKFSVYHSDDLIGPQIYGAMKNVIAIACGIVEGKGFGGKRESRVDHRRFSGDKPTVRCQRW